MATLADFERDKKEIKSMVDSLNKVFLGSNLIVNF